MSMMLFGPGVKVETNANKASAPSCSKGIVILQQNERSDWTGHDFLRYKHSRWKKWGNYVLLPPHYHLMHNNNYLWIDLTKGYCKLKLDGRISNIELSERIGLSASATLRRVQDLERKGIIQGYRAVLDNGLMGVGFIAYVSIGLSSHKAAQLEFEQHAVWKKRWWSATTLLVPTSTC